MTEDLLSQTSAGKKSLSKLDDNMKMVAEKHLASDGTSVKSLEALVPETFFQSDAEDDLKAAAATLRGAGCPDFTRSVGGFFCVASDASAFQ